MFFSMLHSIRLQNKSSAVAEMGDRARTKWPEKWRRGCCVPFRGGAGSPSNTVSHGQRPSPVPSGILIHPTVWSQQRWAKGGLLCTHFLWGGS